MAFIGTTIAFIASSYIDTGYGYKASSIAEAEANSGIQDALIQIDRGNAFAKAATSCLTNDGSSCTDYEYALPVSSDTVQVAIVRNQPTAGLTMITSRAKVLGRAVTMEAIGIMNTSTLQFTITSQQKV